MCGEKRSSFGDRVTGKCSGVVGWVCSDSGPELESDRSDGIGEPAEDWESVRARTKKKMEAQKLSGKRQTSTDDKPASRPLRGGVARTASREGVLKTTGGTSSSFSRECGDDRESECLERDETEKEGEGER